MTFRAVFCTLIIRSNRLSERNSVSILKVSALLLILLSVIQTHASANFSEEVNSSETLNILTYNILVTDNPLTTGPWKHRRKMIADKIRTQKSDIVNVQEALVEMLEDLSKLMPEYAYVGGGRDDGARKGEFSAIFYRKDRLEVLETRTFWLSPTPETPGVIGWDARCTRIVTWAHFRDLKSGKTFYNFNTHFDHWGREAQRQSALLLAAEAKRISNGEPSIVAGDFNVPERSAVYNIFKSSSSLVDAITLVDLEGPRWTHSFYGVYKRKIDFVFVSAGIEVTRHAILPENPFSLFQASDHLPISVRLKIP